MARKLVIALSCMLAAVLCLVLMLCSLPAFGSQEREANGLATIKVATYNLRQDITYPFRHKYLVETIDLLSVDIACLQECWSPALLFTGFDGDIEGQSLRLGVNPVLVSAGSGIIVSSSRVESIPGHNRSYTEVWLRDDSGREIVLFNTHLDHKDSVGRLESARQIADRIKSLPAGTPVILMGDLNADEDSEVVRLFEEVGLIDVYRQQHPLAAGLTFHPHRCGEPISRLDYIFATRDFVVEFCEVADDECSTGDFPSDHFPVVAVLSLE